MAFRQVRSTDGFVYLRLSMIESVSRAYEVGGASETGVEQRVRTVTMASGAKFTVLDTPENAKLFMEA